MKKIISILACLLIFTVLNTGVTAKTPQLDLRVVDNITLFNVIGPKNEEIHYQFYYKKDGKYEAFYYGLMKESNQIGYARFKKDGEYGISYSVGNNVKTSKLVKFKIKNSKNRVKNIEDAIEFEDVQTSIGYGLQFKGKYNVSLMKDIKKPIVYKLYTIDKKGKLKLKETKKAQNSIQEVYFKRLDKERYIVLSYSVNGKVKEYLFITKTSDLKYFDNTFTGI
ncbi:hypothetical protein SM124_08990 [Bacillus sp. 31A1R]|uniref:Uncharacterized protein n=1 Tax=Robertmurraya mangrovi TaxID=3098077 RepID=A0ABU5IXI8_9BACI|nr:hypothetical protein [Bacillus sp. 31A1R]MDZ5471883.1 hypothetical protein [Bacillus sp. 31A1R]